jgi:hypothetical protein
MNNERYYELLMKLYNESDSKQNYLFSRLILLIAEKALDDSITEGSIE